MRLSAHISLKSRFIWTKLSFVCVLLITRREFQPLSCSESEALIKCFAIYGIYEHPLSKDSGIFIIWESSAFASRDCSKSKSMSKDFWVLITPCSLLLYSCYRLNKPFALSKDSQWAGTGFFIVSDPGNSALLSKVNFGYPFFRNISPSSVNNFSAESRDENK